MSENNESIDKIETKLSEKELLLERHRLERKGLNAKITELRHSLTKGDKRRKKGLNAEIDSMTEELKTKHKNELKDLEIVCDSDKPIDELVNELNTVCVHKTTTHVSDDSQVFSNGIKYNETKISRAQRKREIKALKDKQRQQQIAEEMADQSDNQRLIEAKMFENIMDSRGLAIHEIASDGDCMYRAIEHQLSLKNITTNVSQLRQKTCDYMKDNKLDFIPFLTSNTTGDLMNDSEYELYCDEIADTKSWGGQLELRAISHIFKIAIEVIQSSGNPLVIGHMDYNSDKPLILSYHRHAYSLGEHYNSVHRIS